MAAKAFHFCSETPPDSVFSDIQALNKFQNEVCIHFKSAMLITNDEIRKLINPRKELQNFEFFNIGSGWGKIAKIAG